DLRIPLTRALEGEADGGKVLAVVLLTDGQHNDPASPVDKAAELGEQGVPVYAVALGAKVPPTDIVVTSVQAPATVFKGSDAADDKAHVLLIDGEARWEYHYLASALARDRGLDVKAVLFEQPRIGRLGEEQLRQIGHPAKSLPADPDALAQFDCIILGDVTPE